MPLIANFIGVFQICSEFVLGQVGVVTPYMAQAPDGAVNWVRFFPVNWYL